LPASRTQFGGSPLAAIGVFFTERIELALDELQLREERILRRQHLQQPRHVSFADERQLGRAELAEQLQELRFAGHRTGEEA
jgi:hypothetical protein